MSVCQLALKGLSPTGLRGTDHEFHEGAPANTLLPTQKKNNPGTLGCPAFVRFLWPPLRHSTGKIYKIVDAVSQGKSLARAEKRRKMNIIHRMGGVFTTADSRLLGWLVQRTLLVGNLRIQHGTPLGENR